MKGHFAKRTYIDKKTGKKKAASTWTVWYDEPATGNGARQQRSKSGFRTRKEAEAWFNRKADELRRGIVAIDEKTTLREYLESWLAAIESSVTASSTRSYRMHIDLHIVPLIGGVKLRDLRPQHIEDAKVTWLTQKRKDGREGTLSARTAHHIYETLNTALNKAKRQRLIQSNPCEFVDSPRFERREMRSLDAAAGAALMKVFESTDIGAAIVTDLGTGLRRGELLALRWGDIDLDQRLLTVRRSIERVGKSTGFKEPKTRRSRRTIALPAFVVDRLRRHRIEQKERFLALGLGHLTDETLVFERAGEPWVPNTFGATFSEILRESGLPHVRLHDLRHSYASMALEAGVDLKTVSNALGHSTISTTADIYAHVTPSLMRSAADRLDAVVGDAIRKAKA